MRLAHFSTSLLLGALFVCCATAGRTAPKTDIELKRQLDTEVAPTRQDFLDLIDSKLNTKALEDSSLSPRFLGVATYGPAPVIDVTARGVVGDGSTDNSSALQKILEGLDNNGAALYFPAGRYVIRKPVTIDKVGVSIRGAGVRATRFLPGTNADTLAMFKIGNAGGVTLQLEIRDCGVHGYTVLDQPAQNWKGVFLDATAYPLIDSTLENIWFSMSFDTPCVVKGGMSSTIISRCVFELSGGGVYALGGPGVGVYNVLITDCIFWRTLSCVRVDAGAYQGTDSNVVVRNCVVGTHYGGAAFRVDSGTLHLSGVKFDVSTDAVGSGDSVALKILGGVAYVGDLFVWKHGHRKSTANLTEAVQVQGSGSLFLRDSHVANATKGVHSTTTGTLVVNGVRFEEIAGEGILQEGRPAEIEEVSNCTFHRVGLGATVRKDGVRVHARVCSVANNLFLDDAEAKLAPVTVSSATTSGEVKANTVVTDEDGAEVSCESPGVRCEFRQSGPPTNGGCAPGSRVWNRSPQELGPSGKRYAVLSWHRTAAGWVEERESTGN